MNDNVMNPQFNRSFNDYHHDDNEITLKCKHPYPIPYTYNTRANLIISFGIVLWTIIVFFVSRHMR